MRLTAEEKCNTTMTLLNPRRDQDAAVEALGRLMAERDELVAIAEVARDLRCPSCGWMIAEPPLKLSPCSTCSKARMLVKSYFAAGPATDENKGQPK